MILHSGKEIRQVAVTAKPVAYVGKYFEKYTDWLFNYNVLFIP